ncbi:cytochrome P450 [Actinomycetes bacterium KLBMP 9759]
MVGPNVVGTSARAIPRAPGGLPLLGHALSLMRNPLDFLVSLAEHGDLVEVRIGTVRALVVCDPGLTRQVLRDGQTFDKGGPIFQRVAEVLGDNSIGTCPHGRHRRLRSLVQPAFHRDRLPGYARVMTANYAELGWHDGQVVDVADEMNVRALRTLVGTMFSDELAPATTREIIDDTATTIGEIYRRAVRPPLLDGLPTRGNRRYRRARAGLRRVIGEVLAARRAGGADHEDLLTALLTARLPDGGSTPGGLSEAEIGDQLTTFLTGGSETAASALAWTLKLLGDHREVRERLYAELDDVLDGAPATYDALPRLRFTTQVVTEALRMYPPAWVFSRTVTADTDLGGHPVPAGSTIVFSPYAIHRRPDLYPDPDRFDPDRWGEGTPNRGFFFPFGGGARKCIGDRFAMTEAVLALANIVSRWHLEPVGETPPTVSIGISLHPRNLLMRATRRHPVVAGER